MIALLWMTAAQALPLYSQRSGRTCGNCHVSPTVEDPEGWDNPELMERKCTMTCVSCHVDPVGGGLRNTSGRYFGASTVSIMPRQVRSYSDLDRELVSEEAIWRFQTAVRKALGEERYVPSDQQEAEAGIGSGMKGPALVTGRHRKPITMSFWDGRYGSMNADPVLQFGGDLRAAWYSGTGAVFPMQLDLHGAVHPVHHLTLAATASGQAMGPESERASPVYAKRLFLMTHELPGMSWAKAGAFQPGFGTLLDDHTSPVRTLFESSAAESGSTVIGAELGTAPNYPFAQVSVFANDASPLGAAADSGWGAAAQGGWRDLAWSLTGHAQLRRRRQRGLGDLEAAGVAWGLSPEVFWDALPLTWLGEVSAGRRTTQASSELPVASMSELSLLVRNGIVAKVRSDVWTPDAATSGLQHRHGLGLSVSPIPGITVEGTTRVLFTPTGELRPDALMQTHIWF